MSKMEKALAALDRKVDKKLGFLKKFFKKYFAIISTLLLASFMVLFVLRVFYSRPRLIATIIEDDIKMITLAFEKIDAKCSILSVDDENTAIDFLHVKSFTGSRIGPLNLAYPDKWEGPYLNVNPTIQEKHYEVVKAGDGMYILPGEGVLLPNGKTIGKDFKISQVTRVGRLLENGGPLTYEDKKLGVRLTFKIGDWEQWHIEEKAIKNFERILREFSEALPYTKR